MKRVRAGLIASLLALALSTGCRGREAGRHEPAPRAAGPEPTPDTTPVEALRTPAGLALKPEASGTPGAGVTPAGPGGAAGAAASGARTTP